MKTYLSSPVKHIKELHNVFLRLVVEELSKALETEQKSLGGNRKPRGCMSLSWKKNTCEELEWLNGLV
jgi:hypothetical protein